MLHSGPLYALTSLLVFADTVLAIGQTSCVAFTSSASTFPVVSNGKGTPILISPDDWPGVQRAAADFASDIQKVTGVSPSLTNATVDKLPKLPSAIIIGTLGKSSLIQQVVQHANLSVADVEGKWEAFVAKEVQNPLPGISSAYVIIGADKRGSVFALYDHSEQFGVSPWYWWADVPITKHSQLFVTSSGCAHGAPSVKYRGLFLNDEQPALQNWAMEKFTNGTGAALTGSPFNHLFYSKLFELFLRLKANYFWPAQWSSAFYVDDSLNGFIADYYGIVMGTSHEEPMARSIPVEWNLFGVGEWDYSENADFIYQFWLNRTEEVKNYETLFTVGMRGDGDLPLSQDGNIELLGKVISDQTKIFNTVFNGTNVEDIPQTWCLYKEVEGYYENGLRAPDYVTLLWTDDNWGNIRRFPLLNERNRTGGAGVYYHYDYVGDPRDYKWITSSQISKTYEQLSLAIDRQADRIWILNVGDLKPYELGIEFFTTLAWDASVWNPSNLDTFVTSWAQREFGVSSEDAVTVAGIIGNVTRWNARRKPELLNQTTYSLTNYREADTVLADWKATSDASTKIYNSLSSDKQAAFFELVHHPVQASYTVQNMWIASGFSALRASQARISANQYADQVEDLFEQDYQLEQQYHQLLNGKWDHMMDQTHVMYYYWQQPMVNTMPPVTRVQAKKQALPGPLRVGIEGSMGAWPGDNPNQCAQGYNCPPPTLTFDPYLPFGNRYIDIGAGGPNTFNYALKSNVAWLKLSSTSGTITNNSSDERIFVSVDWSQVTGVEAATIQITTNANGKASTSQSVSVVANHTVVPSDFHGFVEGDGVVSIEAAHASRNTSVDGISWTELPGYGRTVSAITPWPRGGDEKNFTAGTGPSVEYDFYTFNTISGGGHVTVTTYVAPTLNGLGPDQRLKIAVQVDSLDPVTTQFIPAETPGNVPPGWDGLDGFVANSIVSVPNSFDVAPGAHTLKIWMVEPTVIVQKIVINTGGVLPSYLGPPESIRV
uniref:Xylan a-1,2-glucuronidase n=1 Tax=Irpex lacteus TaxID=5319 RepID=A0A811BIR4_IRPLA|nr:xylan a-1,2-glucuronidase [Irpex lacteus]